MTYYSRPNNRQTITDLDTALERIRQLEDEQGLGFRVHPRHNFTSMEEAMLGILVSSRDVVSRDKMFSIMYGTHNDPPEPKIFDVMMCRIRRKLRTHGVEVMTVWGRGWYMEPEDRAKIDALRFVAEAA